MRHRRGRGEKERKIGKRGRKRGEREIDRERARERQGESNVRRKKDNRVCKHKM